MVVTRERAIASIVSSKFGIAVRDVERRLVFWRDLEANCVDMAEIGFAVEEAFDFEVTDDDLDGLRTVGDVHDLVARRLTADPGVDVPLAMAA